MAAKESDRSKTSKTSRVMNLISRKQDSAPASGEEATAAPAPASSGPVPPILSSLAPDAAVSVQIRDALEDALEEELNGQPAPPNPAPAVGPGARPPPVARTPAPHPPRPWSRSPPPPRRQLPLPQRPRRYRSLYLPRQQPQPRRPRRSPPPRQRPSPRRRCP